MEGMTKFETIGYDYLATEQLVKFYVQTYGNNNYLGIVNDISRYFTINAHGTLTFYKNALTFELSQLRTGSTNIGGRSCVVNFLQITYNILKMFVILLIKTIFCKCSKLPNSFKEECLK